MKTNGRYFASVSIVSSLTALALMFGCTGSSPTPKATTPATSLGMTLLDIRIVDAVSGMAIPNADVEVIELPLQKSSTEGEVSFALPFITTSGKTESREFPKSKIRVAAEGYKSLDTDLKELEAFKSAASELPHSLTVNMHPTSSNSNSAIVISKALPTQSKPTSPLNPVKDPFGS